MPDIQPSNPLLPADPFDLEVAALRYLDGIIDAAELAQLSLVLRTDRTSRATFVRTCVNNRQIREIFVSRTAWLLDGLGNELEFEAALSELAEQEFRNGQALPLTIQPEDARAGAPASAASPAYRLFAIAAAVLILFSIATILLVQRHANRAGQFAASIERTLDAKWEGEAPLVNDRLPQKELNLTAGYAVLHFDSGATVVMEGPARFTPQPDGIRLAAGSLSAVVPPAAHGFTVQTANSTIVDLGTEFGVRATENGDTSLQVFKGKVSISSVGAADASPPQLVTENSARIVSSGAISSIAFDRLAMVRVGEVDAWVAAQNASPMERWKAWSERNRRDPEMIAYYDFELDGEARDRLHNVALTGASFDGKLRGEDGLPTWGTGRWAAKGALKFDGGTTQCVTLADDEGQDLLDFSRGAEPAKPFTIAVWVKAAPSQINSAGIVSRGAGGSAEQFTIDVWEGCFRTFVRGGGQSGMLKTAAALSKVAPTNQWQYVVAAYDPLKGILSLYVDGTLVADTSAAPHTLIAGGTAVSFGSRVGSGAGNPFIDTLAGSIDEVAVWGRALSSDQIRMNYESGNPN